jgi:hypothetical protein
MYKPFNVSAADDIMRTNTKCVRTMRIEAMAMFMNFGIILNQMIPYY